MTKQPSTATPTDPPEELARLREDLIEFYRPMGSQERMAVERVALAQQSMLRAARLEASLFANPPSKELYTVLESEAFKFFLRYHAQAQRTYSTALKELMFLRSQRPPLQPAPSDGAARPRLVPPPKTTIPPSQPCMPTALALRL